MAIPVFLAHVISPFRLLVGPGPTSRCLNGENRCAGPFSRGAIGDPYNPEDYFAEFFGGGYAACRSSTWMNCARPAGAHGFLADGVLHQRRPAERSVPFSPSAMPASARDRSGRCGGARSGRRGISNSASITFAPGPRLAEGIGRNPARLAASVVSFDAADFNSEVGSARGRARPTCRARRWRRDPERPGRWKRASSA